MSAAQASPFPSGPDMPYKTGRYPAKRIIGIDLSGPANASDTTAADFEVVKNGLSFISLLQGADDADLLELARDALEHGPVAVGIDALLSYNMGGGDRPGDRRLRGLLIAAGMPPGSVMVPTLTRMAYLTLRGIVVSRLLQWLSPDEVHIAEIHPVGALALGGCPPPLIRDLKRRASARRQILHWMKTQGFLEIDRISRPTDHDVAACAAALGVWRWALGSPAWIEPAAPPFHLFDYAC